MDFQHKSGRIEKQRCGVVVCAHHQGGELTPAAEAVDSASDGLITTLIGSKDADGKLGNTLLVQRPAGIAAERLLLVGAGSADAPMRATDFRKLCKSVADALVPLQAKSALIALAGLDVEGCTLEWKVERLVEAIRYADYRFTQTKSTPEPRPGRLTTVQIFTPTRAGAEQVAAGLLRGQALAAGVELTRDLANLPGNICTPSHLAETAKGLAKAYPAVKTQVLDEAQMAKLGMGALLSVSRGSRQPAKLIIMHYKGSKGRKKNKPVVLVGKGLTFDAGGISLKPGAAMDEMKYDMCGGASVFGVIKAAAEQGLELDLVGVVPSSENLPDGDANKPGDIVTSMSGQTIEILNTDAEGRLILCDALTYSARFDPELVIDIATLTGACIVALGDQASGLLGNDDALIHDLLDAGQACGDRAWQLPLWEEYASQLKSPFADVANVGGRGAGTITAGLFLSRFTKAYRWAHLDIAGTAWVSGGANKGATGRPVGLLMEFLQRRAGQAQA